MQQTMTRGSGLQPKVAQSSSVPPTRMPSLASRSTTAPHVGAASRSGRAPVRHVCEAFAPHYSGENAADAGHGRFSHLPVFLTVPSVTVAAGGGGSATPERMGSNSSFGAQVLDRVKANIVMPTPIVSGPKLDDSGSGGDSGNNKGVGGGDGSGGGNDDDDDYAFNEGEDGEGGDVSRAGESFLRTLLPELFDRASLGAVLSEWFKTVAELPLIIRRAVEMGLFSSAQLTRFLSMDVRPSLVRGVARRLPDSVQSEFVGRLMADPGFAHKLVLEAAIASLSSVYYEAQARGQRFKAELDLVAINTLGVAVAAGASLWLISPSRAYGALHKFPWQKMLHSLPNNVFDASGPLRPYGALSRVGGWAAKMGELAGVGAVMGATTALLSQGAVAMRRRVTGDPTWTPSVAPAEMMSSSAGLAAFFALNAHTRYQLVGGVDKFLFDRSTSMLTYLAVTVAARVASNRVGELTRPGFQGLPESSTVARQQRQRSGAAALAARRLQRRVRGPSVAAASSAAVVVVASSSAESLPAGGSSIAEGQVGRVAVPAEAELEAFGVAAAPRASPAAAAGTPLSDAALAADFAAAATRVAAPTPAAVGGGPQPLRSQVTELQQA